MRRSAALLSAFVVLASGVAASADDEAIVFTPPGFWHVGLPAVALEKDAARLTIIVRDRATGRPTACRINVVGPDGHYYQPEPNRLSPYSLTGEWPKTGKGNRVGKAPFRYLGRFFYSTGESEVYVPSGPVRIEVWKGLEYEPEATSIRVEANERRQIGIVLDRPIDMHALGYDPGDLHLHFKRESEDDDQLIFDLMEAEGLRYGCTLAYNEPAGPYHGTMDRMDSPQRRGLGRRSIRTRGDCQILSGQEYRSTKYGHMNLYLRDELVAPGQDYNADNWPTFGMIGAETQRQGGYAFHAHGGYRMEIYADYVQRAVSGVELLQFGEYRELGLEDWYHILNIGYRFPCLGSSDYPACRKLADCVTYVEQDGSPDFKQWLAGSAEGRSFVTSGPLLLLEVDGKWPGSTLSFSGPGPHRVAVKLKATALVAPIERLQLIVSGKVVHEVDIPAAQRQGKWFELQRSIELSGPAWIAARVYSRAPSGAPDADAHTNPVYVAVDGKAPYHRASLDHLLARLDAQMDVQRRRQFADKARVLDYYQKSRDILLRIREQGGLPAAGLPEDWLAAESSQSIDPASRVHSDEELAAFLKPVPPKTPAEALRTFELIDGFHLELVAAEPLVYSPVAAAFDENGNMYVAEMRDYPFHPKPGQKPLGTVRLLRDRDGDGRFDESHVFADGLLWAAGLAVWKGGVFVTAPPDIWYLKDTDGDFKADVRQKVFTGFGEENEQGMLNNLAFGLDHKVYGSSSTNGGSVRPADRPDAPALSLHGKDFRFDPVHGAIEAISGTVQFGNSFDDWGNRFLCSESRPLTHVVLERSYLARNPYLPVATAIANVAGNPVPIYRISPLERWRQIRSSRRIAHGERSAESAGASHHVIDAAAGVTIYRGGAYPPSFYGNAFVSDAQNNLVHRMVLTPDGPTFKASRADQNREFIRSYDNWFRPVNLVNAPDGTLYLLDMSREIIEAVHIPLDVMKHLDLRRGRDQGRIYRIAPKGFQSQPPPRLGTATTAELVAALESAHGWWRDTAHRLVFERQDQAAIAPLRALLRQGGMAQARVHALWSLEGLGAISADDVLLGLADTAPGMRENALLLAERWIERSSDARVLTKTIELATDSDARVRFQAALSLGESQDPSAIKALAKIARSDASDHWTATAILSSVGTTADRLFTELVTDRTFRGRPEGLSLLERLATIVGVRNRPEEMTRLLNALAALPSDDALTQRLVLGMGQGLRQSGGHLRAEGLVRRLLERAKATAADSKAPEPSRIAAVQLLACATFEEASPTLFGLLDPTQPASVQISSLRALSGFNRAEVATLLGRDRQLVPAVRSAAVELLMSREPWTLAFLRAAQRQEADANLIDPARRSLLIEHRNPEIRTLAKAVFGTTAAAGRETVLAEYLPAVKQTGNSMRGHELFRQHCMTCHRIGTEGHSVGPDLTASQFKEPEAVLTHIIDPNRYVAPNYIQYVAVDQSGRVFAGIISGETASSITLRRGEGAEDTLLRSQVEELKSTGKSLMPEDFDKRISKSEMADLVTYLVATHRSPAQTEGPLDIGTLPGLIEPDK